MLITVNSEMLSSALKCELTRIPISVEEMGSVQYFGQSCDSIVVHKPFMPLLVQ